MKYLSVEDVLRLHFQVVEDYGGLHGVRDEGRIKSVVEAPALEAFGQEQYAGVHTKAAVYIRNIISDHPFLDGNKRSGITCAAVFMQLNSVVLICTPLELEDFAVSVATDKHSIGQIAIWLEQNSKLSKTGHNSFMGRMNGT